LSSAEAPQHYQGINRMARTVSKTETYLGYAILLVLVIIAGVIYLRQFQYNPAILTPADIQAKISGQPTLSTSPLLEILQYTPEGLKPLSPPETFGPENLSEKIDGKAELYLSAGFVRLILRSTAFSNVLMRRKKTWENSVTRRKTRSFLFTVATTWKLLPQLCRRGSLS